MKNTLYMLALSLFAATANAATFNVDVTDDRTDPVIGDGVCGLSANVVGGPWCSLRAAIQEANASPGQDQIVLASDTYTLTIGAEDEEDDIAALGDLNVYEDLVIEGNGATIAAGPYHRVFELYSAAVSISDLRIQGARSGTDGAAIFAIDTRLTLDNVRISDGYAENDGGAIFQAGGILTILNSRFDGNYADQVGGAVAVEEAQFVLQNVTFYANRASDGGAIYAAALPTMDFDQVNFWTNTAQRFGGGLMIEGFSLFDGELYDGLERSARQFQINNAQFRANEAIGGSGGGVYVENLLSSVNETTLNLTGCFFQDNGGFHGGGIGIYSGPTVIQDCTFNNNEATSESGQGGAIYTNDNLTLTGVSLEENYARSGGGAVRAYRVQQNNVTTIDNDSFSDGLINDTGIEELYLIVEAQNTADADGDGIPDLSDNCPYVANADQDDVGGLVFGVIDGVGDACQCGDVNSSGTVDNTDAVLITRYVASLPPGVDDLAKCDVTGDGQCNELDAEQIRNHLLGIDNVPLQLCAAAQSDNVANVSVEDASSAESQSSANQSSEGEVNEYRVPAIPAYGLLMLAIMLVVSARRKR